MPESVESRLRLRGVVLCGGRSVRMGRDKAGLPHPDGGTFLQHAIDRLRIVCEEIGLSTSPGQTLSAREDVGRVVDPVSYRGPMIGVVECLADAERRGLDACLFTPVDMPDLTADPLRLLRNAWIQSRHLVCGLDEGSGRLQPLVAIYPVAFLETLRRAAASQDRSLSRWLSSQDPVLVPLPARACRNVNTPDELGP